MTLSSRWLSECIIPGVNSITGAATSRGAATMRAAPGDLRVPRTNPGAAAAPVPGRLHERRAGDPPTGAHVPLSLHAQHRDEHAETDERIVVAAVHDRAHDDGMQAEQHERAGAPLPPPQDQERETHRDGGRTLVADAVEERVRTATSETPAE